jgi:hypothetical protein
MCELSSAGRAAQHRARRPGATRRWGLSARTWDDAAYTGHAPGGQHGVNNAFHLAQKSAAAGAEDRGGAGRSAN